MKYIVRVPVLHIRTTHVLVEIDEVSEKSAEAAVEKRVVDWIQDSESKFFGLVDKTPEDEWLEDGYETSSPSVLSYDQNKTPNLKIEEDENDG